ncbi:MAG: glycosyl transferase, partial [Acidobacteriota bacterium]|nr:glycosyl transferase [Acidobacteriota bacterium]
TDGETGLLLTPDKPADAAKRLLELLADGPRRARLGANARALIEERYTPEVSAKALVARLRALAATSA